MNNIAIFASGSGTNAENIIRYFSNSQTARVTVLLANTPHAYALTRATNLGIPTVVFNRETFKDSDRMLSILSQYQVDYIVLAGFLWLVPRYLTDRFAGHIVNIHPALLPKYGGKGMYGDNVHKAVVAAGEKESGITIHEVNEQYDSGDIIAQFRVALTPEDTPETVAAKIHELEQRYFPQVIERHILSL